MAKIQNDIPFENGHHKENGSLKEKFQKANGTSVTSDLAYIQCKTANPLELFKEWHTEATSVDLVNPNALCFSTSSKDGNVSSRHLLLRRQDEDGFVIMTDRRSRKVQELTENPRASIAFLWCYRKDGKAINRQVRMEGDIIELDENNYRSLYNNEPLYCKIRAHICPQGQPIEWSDLKEAHDNLYEEVTHHGRVLEMPNHFVAFKLIPKTMEFYFAYDTAIGDRLLFLAKDTSSKHWECKRIAA